MPSIIATPLALKLAGGTATVDPVRLGASPLVLALTGGGATFSVGGALGEGETTPTLNRLQRQMSYFDKDGRPTVQMQVHWQRTMEAIELAFRGLTGRVDDISSLVARIEAALALATAANDKAGDTEAKVNVALSFVDPVNVLSAANDGTVTIATHTRVYVDGVRVAVDGGTVTGFAAGDYVSVYYQDAARAGGAVAYQGTTDAVAQTGARHVVGQVTIPAAGAVANTGAGVAAPGYVPPDIVIDIGYLGF